LDKAKGRKKEILLNDSEYIRDLVRKDQGGRRMKLLEIKAGHLMRDWQSVEVHKNPRYIKKGG